MSASSPSSPSSQVILLTQVALVFTAVSVAGQVTLYGGLTIALSRALRISAGMLGLCSTTLYLGVGLAYVPGGFLADRYGANRVLPLSLLLISLGSVLSVLITQFWWILLWHVVIGLGMGATITASLQKAHRLGARAGISQGIFGGAMQVGAALGAFLPPLLSQHWLTWQGIFLFWGMAASLMTLLWLVLPEREGRREVRRRRIREAFRSPRVVQLGLVHAATFGIGQAIAPWLVVLCQAQGIPSEKAALVGALALFVGMVGRLLGGWLLRLLPARVVLRLGQVLTIAALGMLTVVCALPGIGWGKTLVLLTILLLWQVGCTLPYAAVQAEAGRAGVREMLGPGTAQGVVSELSAPVCALGPALIGWIAAQESFALSFGLFAGSALLALLVIERGTHSTPLTDSRPLHW